MAGWVRLAVQCVSAEFSYWSTCLCFNIFAFSGEAQQNQVGVGEGFQQRCFQRLGLTFNVPWECLRNETNSHLSFARHHFNTIGGGEDHTVRAWIASIKTRTSQPGDNLRHVLHRFNAWDGATSSVVEQGFSKVSKCHGSLRHLSAGTLIFRSQSSLGCQRVFTRMGRGRPSGSGALGAMLGQRP